MTLATAKHIELLNSLGIQWPWAQAAVTILVLLSTVSGGLAVVVKLVRSLRRSLAVRRGGPDQRRRVQHRALFARHVESRIRDLDNKEEWSDHRFAELEAEVETLGIDEQRQGLFRLLPPRRRGLRHERSLSRALVRSREPLILLQGDPGSGKSVALRFVARRMAERAMRAKNLESIIPLYVNLKALHPEDRPVDAQLIHDFVLERMREGTDRDIHRFLDREFSAGKEAGTWFFLFDSFDEIPSVLSATEVDETVRLYSEAIFAFMHGLNRCRAVVASRHFRAPPRYGLPTFRIVSLSERRKHELIKKAGLGEVEIQLLVDLPAAPANIVALSANPLFLGLLCEYVRERGELPQGWHDVFEVFVTHRMVTDADKLEQLFGIGADELRRRAEEIAFTMTETQGLGLSPARSSLRAACAAAGFGAGHRLNVAMDALEWIKLARSETGGIIPTDPTFTFAHRRFTEYFATDVVLREPARVPPYELLTNASWRETAVTLAQAQPEQAGELLAEAERILKPPSSRRADPECDFDWPPGTLHVLGLLQSGFAGRTVQLPSALRERIGAILSDAFARGNITDRKWVLEVAGTAPDDVLAQMLRQGLGGRSPWLRDVAYRQVARLAEIPPDLATEIRRGLVKKTSERTLRSDWMATRAQLLRLRPSRPFMETARLLRAVPPIDLTLLLGVTTVAISMGANAGVMVALALSAHALYYPSAREIARVRRWVELNGKEGPAGSTGSERSDRPGVRSKRAMSFWGMLGALLGIYARLGICLAALVNWSAAPGAWIAGATTCGLAVTWGLAATWACLRDPPGGVVAWPFVHVRIVAAVIRRIRAIPVVAWVVGVPALALYALFVWWVGDTDPADWLFYGLIASGTAWFIVVSVRVAVRAGREYGRDLMSHRRWARSNAGSITPAELLDRVGELHSSRGAAKLIRDVRTQQLLIPDAEGALVIRDLLRAIDHAERGTIHGERTVWRSFTFADWIKSREGDAREQLARFAADVPDELGQLLEELQREEALPAA